MEVGHLESLCSDFAMILCWAKDLEKLHQTHYQEGAICSHSEAKTVPVHCFTVEMCASEDACQLVVGKVFCLVVCTSVLSSLWF
jgi:hypothetical protein